MWLAATLALGVLFAVLGSAAPAFAAGSIVVSPSTDLLDGQTVEVSGTGFTANTFLGIAMCEPAPSSTLDCDLSPLGTVTTDGEGSFTTTFSVRRIMSTSNGNIDCADAPGTCVVVVGETDFTQIATFPLSFDPEGPFIPPLDMTFVLDPRAVIDRRTGIVTLTATVTCSRPTTAFVSGELLQIVREDVAEGFMDGSAPCDEQARAVILRAKSTGVAEFKQGKAIARGSAFASEGGDFVQRQFSLVVKVSPAPK
jgi:hypothetical protein